MTQTQWGCLRLRSRAIQERLGRERPFENYHILIIQHVLDDLVELVRCLTEQLGAPADGVTVVGIPYSSMRSAAAKVEALGCAEVLLPGVYPSDGLMQAALQEAVERSKKAGAALLVLEDGGYAAPAACQLMSAGRMDPSAIRGVVEQTTRGVRIARALHQQGHLRFPVIAVPECVTKQEVEPKPIARAVEENLLRLMARLKEGRREVPDVRRVGVYGAGGSIGHAVATRLRRSGREVWTHDTRTRRRHRLQQSGFRALTEADLGQLDLVIGSVGATTITAPVIQRLPTRAVLASTSSRQVEIDLEWLYGNAEEVHEEEAVGRTAFPIPVARHFLLAQQERIQQVTVLYDGFPVNFSGPSLPPDVGDAVLSLLLEGLAAVTTDDVAVPGVWNGDDVMGEQDMAIWAWWDVHRPDTDRPGES